MKLRLWQLSASHGRHDDGSPDVTYWAELYEQSLGRHLWGRLAWWLNNTCTKIAPKFFDPSRGGKIHDDGTFTDGWRMRFELWGVYDAEHRKRTVIERVQVKDRDPETWHLHPANFAPEETREDAPAAEVDVPPEVFSEPRT